MLYTPQEYGKIYGNISRFTVYRKIKNGMINSKHTVHKISRFYMIEVPTSFIIKKA
jgi:hypothetical protein